MCFSIQTASLVNICTNCEVFAQVFEEPHKKQMLYWVIAIVAVLFVLYNLIKYSQQ